MPKRIAIIGAGVGGIISAKCCLEAGLEIVVFEKTDYIGGLWRYQETVDVNGIASVMKSTVINTSKELSAFSDFPPPAENPNYMHNSLNIAYYDAYASRFSFSQYVRFRHEIVSIDVSPDYEETGRWTLRYRNLANPKQISEEIFDGVMICVGHHNIRNEPKFQGQDRFKGRILHTHSLKHARGFEDKTVVVVGIGNSATDAAVELATVTKQVYLSTRRGSWIFHRVGHNGVPYDLDQQTRLNWCLMRLLPFWLICTFVEWKLNGYLNHAKYGLKPAHRCLSAHITMNDALPNRLMCGTVKVKSDIDYFTEDGVVFKGESTVTPCDAVVLGTGYKVDIPFLPDSLLQVNQNRVRLYKHMFIPHLKHPETLAVIGLIQTVGAGIPAGELQSRWYAHLNSRPKVTPGLPSRQLMERDIEKKTRAIQAKYYESERHTFQVDWVPYMDELAAKFACKPPLWKYLFSDFPLFWALVFGPAVPYQYRLVGPNAWKGAREAILTTRERTDAPLKTKATILEQTKGRALNDLTLADVFVWLLIGGILLSAILTFCLLKMYKF